MFSHLRLNQKRGDSAVSTTMRLWASRRDVRQRNVGTISGTAWSPVCDRFSALMWRAYASSAFIRANSEARGSSSGNTRGLLDKSRSTTVRGTDTVVSLQTTERCMRDADAEVHRTRCIGDVGVERWRHRISFAECLFPVVKYDTMRDAILTCARKPTWVSLIYRTKPTTKNVKTEKN